jgi:hypothetical protein
MSTAMRIYTPQPAKKVRFATPLEAPATPSTHHGKDHHHARHSLENRALVVAAPGDDDGHPHPAGGGDLHREHREHRERSERSDNESGLRSASAASASAGSASAGATSGGLTMAGVSSSRHSIVKNEHSIMATMPRLAAVPRRTSIAAMASSTEATTATAAARGHGDRRINESARMVRRTGSWVLATSTADLLAAYQTLRSFPAAPPRIRAVHLGGVAAALYLCAVPPEVALAALAATSVLRPQSLLTYLELVLPENAHALTTGRLCLVAKWLDSGAEATSRRWATRRALLLALAAAADTGRADGWLDWIWPSQAPLNPAWPVATAWTPERHRDPAGRLYHPVVVLNAARAPVPGAFDAEALTQQAARELLAPGPGRAAL